jgi:hypothetical protein
MAMIFGWLGRGFGKLGAAPTKAASSTTPVGAGTANYWFFLIF